MDENFLDEAVTPGSPRAQHTLLVASLLHLMSHYTVNSAVNSAVNSTANTEGPCLKLASVIERHLSALARLPDADPVLRATCEQLSGKWAALVDNAMPPPRPTLLARILRQTARNAGDRALAT